MKFKKMNLLAIMLILMLMLAACSGDKKQVSSTQGDQAANHNELI